MSKYLLVPGKSAKPQRESDQFNRIQPLLKRGVLLKNYANPNGIILVAIRRVAGDRFYCKVGATEPSVKLPSTIDLTQPEPANIFRLTNLSATEIYQNPSVPVTGIGPTAPLSTDAPNQWISIGAYRDGVSTSTLIDDDTFPFFAIPALSTASVSGKGCLFLAYTDPGATLPNLGLSIPTNRPTSLVSPMDGTTLLVNVPKINGANQTWKNHNRVIGPSGELNDPDLTPRDLISATLASDGMTPQTAPPQNILDGLLAGMWDFGAANRGTPPACVELAIGVGLDDGSNSASLTLPTLSGPVKPDNLLLGLHSDKWSGTTGGALNLALSWS